MGTVRLLHSIYARDHETGEQRKVARQGQTAQLDRNCFDAGVTDTSAMLISSWLKGVRIRLDETDELVDVHCWNLEPIDG